MTSMQECIERSDVKLHDCAVYTNGMPFYVNIFLKKKYGEPAKITMLDIEDKGYIHDTEEADDFGFELVPELEALEVTEKDVESEKLSRIT